MSDMCGLCVDCGWVVRGLCMGVDDLLCFTMIITFAWALTIPTTLHIANLTLGQNKTPCNPGVTVDPSVLVDRIAIVNQAFSPLLEFVI